MHCLHTFPPIHFHDASIIIYLFIFWIRIRLDKDFFKDLMYIVNIVKQIRHKVVSAGMSELFFNQFIPRNHQNELIQFTDSFINTVHV